MNYKTSIKRASIIFIAAFSLALTGCGRVTVTPTSTNSVDWTKVPYLGPVIVGIKDLGGDELITYVIVGLIGFLLANIKHLFNGIKWVFTKISRLILKRNKDYVFEQAYLDWMIGQYRHLGLLPAQIVALNWAGHKQIEDLENIYTRLSLSTQPDDESWDSQSGTSNRWARKIGRIGRLFKLVLTTIAIIPIGILGKLEISFNFFDKKLIEKVFPETPYTPGNISLIIDRTPRLLVKGDPGSGKTTTLRYLALTCARALRNKREDGDSSSIVWKRLFWRVKPFPIVIRLSRHSEVISWKDQKTLIDAIKDELPLDVRRTCPEGFFERLLNRKPCLVLLDAFDELGSQHSRNSMAEYISGFLEVYGNEKHRVVVTSRIIGYEGQLGRLGFESRTVQPLSEGERKALIRQRYKAFAIVEKIGRSEDDMRSIELQLQDREKALLGRINEIPRLAQLATNPMLLSLVTLVHFLKVELPDERVLLYRDCVEILTERWQIAKRQEIGSGTTLPGKNLTLAQKITILCELAYAMQQRRNPLGGHVLLPRDVAISVTSDALSKIYDNQYTHNEIIMRSEEWITSIQVDSGILLEQGTDADHNGEPLIGFSHLTFQEYLCALAIKTTPQYYSEFLSNLLNPAWHEVVRLYVVLTDDATDVVKQLLSQSNNNDGLFLAGWCLSERVHRIDSQLKIQVVNELKAAYVNGFAHQVSEIFENAVNSPNVVDVIPFLCEQVKAEDVDKQKLSIRALSYIDESSSYIAYVKNLLIETLEKKCSIEVRVAAFEALSKIGDPRFDDVQPLLQKIPSFSLAQTNKRLSINLVSAFFSYLAVCRRAQRRITSGRLSG